MKTNANIRTITVVVILFLAANISLAGTHDPKATSELKKVMQKEVPYPKFAQENLQQDLLLSHSMSTAKAKYC